jgi:hypothetical protein
MANKFDRADLEAAMSMLKMLSYFPPDPGAQGAVMELLAKMCPSREALGWLIETMTNIVGEWKGPAELRGLLCTQFRPADGIERSCSIPGFRPDDFEAKHYDEHQAIKAGGTPAAVALQFIQAAKVKTLN